MSKLRDDLVPRMTGRVLAAGDPGYDDEISTYNTAVRHSPDLVVAAADSADVAEAIRFAGQRGLPVNVQSTGHTDTAVRAGLLISTRPLAGVEIDPGGRTATIGAGTQWKDVAAVAAPHGLFPVSGAAPGVGVVGYLLGGGFGPLVRSHGVSSDYLLGATVVTGTGEILDVDADTDPQLLWALRGGKKGLGVVTRVRIRLVELTRLYGGALFYDTADIEKALRGWLAWAADVDPQVTTSAALVRFPPLEAVPAPLRGRHLLGLRFAYPGADGRGEQLAAPLRALASVHLDGLGELPATEIGRIHNDPTDPGPSWVDGALLTHADDDLATAFLASAGPGADSPFIAVELRQLGGAAAVDVPGGSAVTGRDAAFVTGVVAVDPEHNPADLPAAAAAHWQALGRWCAREVNANFTNGARDTEQFAAAWTPEVFARLEEVRRRVDPERVFDLGFPGPVATA